MTYTEFCNVILQLMAACGGRITSWGRSPFGNAEVGGVRYSYHQLMMGVDWTWSDEELEATTIAGYNGRQRLVVMARRLGFRVLDEGSHIHLEPKR